MIGRATIIPPALRERLADLFADAVERAPAERAEFLDEVCHDLPGLRQEVEALLRAHQASDGFLEGLTGQRMAAMVEAEAGPVAPGDRIGPYRLLQELGHGGMGVVYLAERADGVFEQRVALKLLRGLASDLVVRRFVREQRILARLEHSNITRLLDAGATAEGRPYLVMEYVAGMSLTAHCDGGRLGVDARLRLMMDVCAAVHYAHGRLVIHRDLKPPNILVSTEGQVKVLDFGIAKLLIPHPDPSEGTQTIGGLHALTPEYAAPEQVRGGPITTATDVYALGAVLYELISGRPPRQLSGHSLAEIVRTASVAPRPLSAVVTPRRGVPQRISRDLDAIASTALRPEPEQRHPSADALRDDIRRHLARLPVAARRDSAFYRISRLVRRNPIAVAAASVAVASLAGGLTATAWQARALARERDVARSEADKAARVSGFVTDLFFLADPARSGGEDVTLRMALDSGRVWIDRELGGQPELYVQMATRLGEVYFRLGKYDAAREVLQAGLALGTARVGEANEGVLTLMLVLIKVLEDLGRTDTAEVLARRALVVQQRIPALKGDDFATTHGLLRLGRLLWHEGRLRDAEAVLRRALTILPRDHAGALHRRTVLNTALAHVRREAGDPTDAEALLRDVLRARRAIWGPEHPEVAQVLMNLGKAVADQGRYAEGEGLVRQGLGMYQRFLGPNHIDVALAEEDLAGVLREKGDAAAAAIGYRRAVAVLRRALPPDHPRLAATLYGYGLALLDLDRPADAEAALLEALRIRHAGSGQSRPRLTEIEAALAAAGSRPPSSTVPNRP